jgi:glycosyltransferase involved in cell wall biosynthesis
MRPMDGASGDRVNLHVYPSPFTHESRIFRETSSLIGAGYFDRIVMVGVGGADLPDREARGERCEIWRLPRSAGSGLLSKIAGTLAWSRRVLDAFAGAHLDCINCHSLPVLPLCVRLAKMSGAKLIYDAHELETETIGLHWLRKSISKMTERRLVRQADAVIVVSESISEWYARTYSIEAPMVVLNCPNRAPPGTRSNLLREHLGIAPKQRIFLYLGVLEPGRGIQLLCDAVERLQPHPALVLMGEGSLRGMILERRRGNPDIHWMPAVPPGEVLSVSSSADVGLCLIEDTCLSYRYSMPNKLFEYIGAGIPVLCSDLPEMRRVVTQYDIGVVARELSASAIADAIKELQSQDLQRYTSGLSAAADRYQWGRESAALYSVYERLGFRASAK